jgi:hypothetical protein
MGMDNVIDLTSRRSVEPATRQPKQRSRKNRTPDATPSPEVVSLYIATHANLRELAAAMDDRDALRGACVTLAMAFERRLQVIGV